MNIGKLKHRITIQKYGTNTTENNFDEEDWIDFKTVWASVNNLWGKEFYAAKAINEENTVEFIIRYSKELEVLNSKEYRIKWKDREFDITFIDNIRYENRWLKIKTMERL